MNQKSNMHVDGKSDGRVLPTKCSNKSGNPLAEGMEGRRPAIGPAIAAPVFDRLLLVPFDQGTKPLGARPCKRYLPHNGLVSFYERFTALQGIHFTLCSSTGPIA
jgi:hypothetical protein